MPWSRCSAHFAPSPAVTAEESGARPVKPVTHPSDSPVRACRHAADMLQTLTNSTLSIEETLSFCKSEKKQSFFFFYRAFLGLVHVYNAWIVFHYLLKENIPKMLLMLVTEKMTQAVFVWSFSLRFADAQMAFVHTCCGCMCVQPVHVCLRESAHSWMCMLDRDVGALCTLASIRCRCFQSDRGS